MFRPSCRVLAAALLLSALSAVMPESTEAQFAGVPRPPRRRPVNIEERAAPDSARRDTIPPTRLPDMQAWVDSATIALGTAGAATDGGPAATAADSVLPPRAGDTGGPRGARGRDSTMRDGARAPDTATPLPTMALAGALTLAAGLFLRRRGARPRG